MTRFQKSVAAIARIARTKAPSRAASPEALRRQDVTIAALAPAGLLRPSGW